MLAYTGLETVANLAEEARRPSVDLPRSLFVAIGTVVTIYVAIAVVALSAFPGPETKLGTDWLRAPLVGVATEIGDHLPDPLGGVLRFFVGVSGALILVAAVTTSISGFSRLAYSLGEHGQLPRAFGRLHRRTLVSPQAIVSAAVISSAIVIASSFVHHDVTFLASVFSFGVLLAFTAAQLAVIKLRVTEPDLPRPYRSPFNVSIRGKEIPLPAIVGAVLTFAVWIVSLATHPGARYAGPAWLRVGLVVFVARPPLARRGADRAGDRARRAAPADVPHFRQILVPMKLGIIGEEMVATAVKLAERARRARRGDVRDPRAARAAARRARWRTRTSGPRPRSPRRNARRGARRRGQDEHGAGPGDRPRDRRPRARARRRPDRARLLAALAPPVALLLADGRLRAPPRTLRGADRRVPAERARRGARRNLNGSTRRPGTLRRVKVIVVGCGRVGSAVALELREAGWDVSVIDEREEALGRLGDDWTGEFLVGHGMDLPLLREAGIEDADAVVVATDGDNSNIVIGQMAQKQFGVRTVVVRILDPARAEFYSSRGLNVVCPTSSAITTITDAVRTSEGALR